MISDTQAEWFIVFQGCFRQNISSVTIYAFLRKEALIYSFNVVGRPNEQLLCSSCCSITRSIREMGQKKQELNTVTSMSYARTVMQ